MERYIVFDVETPNHENHRMSAIGISVVENGALVREFSTLTDPECEFDSFNIRLTGITPEAVIGKPTFSELWQEIEPIMASGLLVAHNAQFDMSVLSKCLRAYGIEWKSRVFYACTCQMGRLCYPDMENHRLDTLCRHVGIDLNHHDAGSDSRAAALLLIDYMENGIDIRQYIREYDMLSGRTIKQSGGKRRRTI